MKNFSIIVAMDKNRGIGKDGGLVWHLPADMRFFKETTLKADDGKQNAVIMGRKTWESIPEKFQPLSNRLNVVLTRNSDFLLPEGCLKFDDFECAIDSVAQQESIDKIFVIGGANIYKQAIYLPGCKFLYITQIQEVFDCDVFFPEFLNNFDAVSTPDQIVENDCHFSFQLYQRK